MTITQKMLGEFENEMANTRKTLERVPTDKFGYKPHPKSPTMGWLAGHVATLPSFVSMTVESDSFDVLSGPRNEFPETSEEALKRFDETSQKARAALQSCTDEAALKPWTLLAGEKKLFELPKIAVIRTFAMNHLIHHRAQLTVYLRLNDIPVPALYGPSADENVF